MRSYSCALVLTLLAIVGAPFIAADPYGGAAQNPIGDTLRDIARQREARRAQELEAQRIQQERLVQESQARLLDEQTRELRMKNDERARAARPPSGGGATAGQEEIARFMEAIKYRRFKWGTSMRSCSLTTYR
jgi:hypothetical protein